MNTDKLALCLHGIALGDSLGLPMEGMNARRSNRMFGGPLRQRMIAGHGILSDDTLMAVATVQALHAAPDDPERFAIELARRLRLWFWTLPPGIGLATLKSCLRLSVGVGANKSGVNSAGNGPAIRAVVLGCALADEPSKRSSFIDASTRVTHTHPLAGSGSQLVGLAAALAGAGRSEQFDDEAAERVPDWPWATGYPSSGPTGFIVHTVNASIECWKGHPASLAAALPAAIVLGGDTDSVAAIVGGIIGASGAPVDSPAGWDRWVGWPRPGDFLGIAGGSVRMLPVHRLLAPHAFSLCLILPHVLRRGLPPY